MSTATIAGRSGAARMSAKRGSMRTRTSSPDGRTNATTQPVRQPSAPASQGRQTTRQMTLSSFTGRPADDALVAEQREIERDEFAMHDQLGDGAAGGRRLLQAVAREAVREDEIRDLRMPSDHGVLVERVVVVVPGPGALQLERLHGGHAMRQHRPDHIVEQRVVHLEIGRARVGLLRRRDAADIDLALRADPHAGRIDHQRHAGQRRAARDHEHAALARLDRQRDAGKRRDIAGLRSGGVDQRAAGDARRRPRASRRRRARRRA